MPLQPIRWVRLIVALTLCAGCAAQADTSAPRSGRPAILPPQVSGWQAVTDSIRKYPGNGLTIHDDIVQFSAAGRFRVKFVGRYGHAMLFKVLSATVPAGRTDEFICTRTLSYLAMTPAEMAMIHEPILSFEAFDGVDAPDWNKRESDPNDCGAFTYGAPLKN